MNELVVNRADPGHGDPAYKPSDFVAKKGSLLIKETRDVAIVKNDNGHKLVIATVICSSARATHTTTSYSIRLAQTDELGNEQANGVVNFEDVDELTGALDRFSILAEEMLQQQRDYTEVTYTTKENVKVGFYYDRGNQQAFVDAASCGVFLFLPVEKLRPLKRGIQMAKQHLVECGARSEDLEVD